MIEYLARAVGQKSCASTRYNWTEVIVLTVAADMCLHKCDVDKEPRISEQL